MKALSHALREHIQPKYAESLGRFFKCGPGEYGEGDCFLGIRVPDIRAVSKRDDGSSEVGPLLRSKWHEERVLALLILVRRFERGDATKRQEIFDCYLSSTQWINNWDLVDISAYQIVGRHLLDQPRRVLRVLAASHNLWERRIAIVSTFAFIRAGDCDDTFVLSKKLLHDPEDLIHKACGWMLREAGKKDLQALEDFLTKHQASMPRTMLRYAIEKFPEKRRKEYLLR